MLKPYLISSLFKAYRKYDALQGRQKRENNSFRNLFAAGVNRYCANAKVSFALQLTNEGQPIPHFV